MSLGPSYIPSSNEELQIIDPQNRLHEYLGILKCMPLTASVDLGGLNSISSPSTSIRTQFSFLPEETSDANSEVVLLNSTLSETTKIAIGVVLGATVAFILAISSFFIWRRHDLQELNSSTKQGLHSRRASQLENSSGVDAEMIQKSTRNQGNVSIRKWRAPLVIVSGLLAGLGLALAHHFFYLRLNGVLVDNFIVSQSWTFRLGNLFAFLVRLSFGISITTAFVQWQWFKVRQQAIKVKDFDDVSGIFGNILNFKSGIWLRFPILTLLAIIFWHGSRLFLIFTNRSQAVNDHTDHYAWNSKRCSYTSETKSYTAGSLLQ